MLEAEGLQAVYPGAESAPALRGVSFRIAPGERVALMGSNGSGKTTLVRCVDGLLRPAAGDVRVDGLSVLRPGDLIPLRRRVGLVFQNPDDQIVSTTVEREIAFGPENLGVPTEDIVRRVDEALRRFRLEPVRTHAPHLLSGGERQRLALASVWVMEPAYYVLDEPTSLLDPEGRAEIRRFVTERPQAGFLIVTQYPDEALFCGRLLLLRDGALVFDGPAETAFRDEELCRAAAVGVPASIRLEVLWDGLRVQSGRRKPGPPSPAASSSSISGDPPPPAFNHSATWLIGPGQRAAGLLNVRLENVSYSYRSPFLETRNALDGVSAAFGPGECVALVGPSGSGKTTLIQHLNGLLRPTSGAVVFDGLDLADRRADLNEARRRIGLVFQLPETQLFEETVFADVAFGPKNLGLSGSRLESAVAAAMERVGLSFDAYRNRSPFHLSGGEKRRAALAGVFAMEPEWIVLDEPTAGLDWESSSRVESILAGFHKSGRSVLFVSHDMDLVARLAERVILLEKGRLRYDGPVRPFFLSDHPERTGLGRPSVWAAMESFRSRGIPVRTDVLTMEEAEAELRRAASLLTKAV
ncbi:MAG: energy-coupling factor transporter ATPase [bacterium]|nr:energy-coupling factor transporter ATPase [bacterium]